MEKYVPDGFGNAPVKCIAVSAHKDDTEMFALKGIADCYGKGGFVAVVLTDGGGCPRAPQYAGVSDEDMAELRTAEQKRVAAKGGYTALWLLEKSSAEVKECSDSLVGELAEILRQYPSVETLYLHNPFDAHPTHVAACVAAIKAVNLLNEDEKPRKIYGCEVWRGLDWLADRDRVALDVSGYDALAAALMDEFETQNAAKRYDIAAQARRNANATFGHSHENDVSESVIYAVDMTSLAHGETLDDFAERMVADFVSSLCRDIWHK